MAVFEIMFSPTGGTKKVSSLFTKTFASESVVIDLLNKDQDFSSCVFSAEDVCIVSVPSYGGRVPEPAVLRLSRMQGNGAKAILLVVYGNRDYDDTFAELQDTLEAAGFVCAAGVAAIAQHSIMPQFASGRPDTQDEEQLRHFAESIRVKLNGQIQKDASNEAVSEEGLGKVTFPGNRPYRKYSGVPMKPQAGKACTQCGTCAKECPVGAIPVDEPSKTNVQQCISCMRCMAICPENARSINKALLAAGSMKLKKACSVRKENECFLSLV